MITAATTENSDWVKGRYFFAWGLPKLVLVLGFLLSDPIRIVMCSGALIWMGTACLANARHCGRTHCLFTGPFYLAMAVVVPFHGWRIVDLGTHGWWWIALSIVVGLTLLWVVPERLLGPYIRQTTAS